MSEYDLYSTFGDALHSARSAVENGEVPAVNVYFTQGHYTKPWAVGDISRRPQSSEGFVFLVAKITEENIDLSNLSLMESEISECLECLIGPELQNLYEFYNGKCEDQPMSEKQAAKLDKVAEGVSGKKPEGSDTLSSKNPEDITKTESRYMSKESRDILKHVLQALENLNTRMMAIEKKVHGQ